MRTDWLVVIVVGLGTAALKAAGPVLLGGRPLPPRVQAVVAMLAPALLAALVATAALTSGQRLLVDARAVGVIVAAIAIWRTRSRPPRRRARRRGGGARPPHRLRLNRGARYPRRVTDPVPDPPATPISWLLLGLMAAAVVIGLFLMVRSG